MSDERTTDNRRMSVRFDEDLVYRIDTFLSKTQVRWGVSMHRSDAIRLLITQALESQGL